MIKNKLIILFAGLFAVSNIVTFLFAQSMLKPHFNAAPVSCNTVSTVAVEEACPGISASETGAAAGPVHIADKYVRGAKHKKNTVQNNAQNFAANAGKNMNSGKSAMTPKDSAEQGLSLFGMPGHQNDLNLAKPAQDAGSDNTGNAGVIIPPLPFSGMEDSSEDDASGPEGISLPALP